MLENPNKEKGRRVNKKGIIDLVSERTIIYIRIIKTTKQVHTDYNLNIL